MPRRVEELPKECITALGIYSQLVLGKFGKTKKAKYEEIAKRMSLSVNTIKNWIYKYYSEYEKYSQEIKDDIEKDLKKFILEGLTEKQSKYIKARMNGFGKEEAKKSAGYSEKTKVDTIEKSKAISFTMSMLRERLIEDTTVGAAVIINRLLDVAERAKNGQKSMEYIDEVNPFGRVVKKTIKEEKSFSAELGAYREINKMLGYDYAAEKKLNPTVSFDEETGEKTTILSDEDMK